MLTGRAAFRALCSHNGITLGRSVRMSVSLGARDFARCNDATDWPDPSSMIRLGDGVSSAEQGGSKLAPGVKYCIRSSVASLGVSETRTYERAKCVLRSHIVG